MARQPTALRRDCMAPTIETLLRENLHGVFGEHDIRKRQGNIARLWAEDGVFVDHNSRYEGHSSVDHAASKLVEKFPNFVFTECGELQESLRTRCAPAACPNR